MAKSFQKLEKRYADDSVPLHSVFKSIVTKDVFPHVSSFDEATFHLLSITHRNWLTKMGYEQITYESHYG